MLRVVVLLPNMAGLRLIYRIAIVGTEFLKSRYKRNGSVCLLLGQHKEIGQLLENLPIGLVDPTRLDLRQLKGLADQGRRRSTLFSSFLPSL